VQLTLHMLRNDLPRMSRGLRKTAANYVQVPTHPIGDLNATLLVRQSDPKPPRWLRDLSSIAAGDLLPLATSSCAALLLLRHRGHRFILAYGAGRFTIDPSAVQPGFGLRVVANSVAASRVKSADTRRLGGRTRSQRTAMASTGPLYELGIEPSEEWVRQLEGAPPIELANAVAGSDSLRMSVRNFSLTQLAEKLDQIIEKYEATDYKQYYDFLDYFAQVNRGDKVLCDALKAELTTMLRAHSSDIDFADPDILEPLLVDHYVLRSGRLRSPDLPELTQDTVFAALDQWNLQDPLKDVSVEAIDSSGEYATTSFPLLDYVAAEVRHNGSPYALSIGQWFLVDEHYATVVQKRIDQIVDLTDELTLDAWRTAGNQKEDEGAYNERVGESRGWKVLDKDNFPIGGPNQKVEVCDLLTPDKQLVCVKRMSKSATLSHLFQQGSVSAQLMANNAEGYRDRVVDALRDLVPGAEFGAREQWTVVYAIGTDKPGRLADSLYFFSKVSLDSTARQLRNIGVNVALARIPLKRP
jgi:uncharacterized protein (TIGR04141 family)